MARSLATTGNDALSNVVSWLKTLSASLYRLTRDVLFFSTAPRRQRCSKEISSWNWSEPFGPKPDLYLAMTSVSY